MKKILSKGIVAPALLMTLALSACATDSSIPARGVQVASIGPVDLSDATAPSYFQSGSSLRNLECPRPVQDTSADAARCARQEMRRRLAPTYSVMQ
jgi:hypothetical protein